MTEQVRGFNPLLRLHPPGPFFLFSPRSSSK
uniref:Uncharacterized protein n=1 Tax=Anguilla anguilla TaxID=7936 RepID=A0A0E9QEG6_ANGAN